MLAPLITTRSRESLRSCLHSRSSRSVCPSLSLPTDPQAVILIADAISATLSAAFSNGGHPILIELSGDQFRADFVIATSVFYDAATGGFKADEEPVVKSGSIVRKQPQPAGPSGTAKKPLFDPATPPPPGGDDEDEFGDIEFNEDDFAFIDIVSQAHPTQQRATPAPEAPRVLAADSSGNRKPALGLEEDETFGFGEMGGATAYSKQATSPKRPSDEYGSTQGQGPHKRVRPILLNSLADESEAPLATVRLGINVQQQCNAVVCMSTGGIPAQYFLLMNSLYVLVATAPLMSRSLPVAVR